MPDTEPWHTRTLAVIDATSALGYTTAGTADVTDTDDSTRYTEIVDELEAASATFATSGLGPDSTRQLREAASGRAASVVAWFCDARCYDESFLTDGGAAVEGQYVAIETALLSERADIPALRTYLKLSARADADPSYEGLRAFVTGLLFEQAADAVVDEHGENGVTRVRLFDALANIHDFTAGGIVGPTDVASGTPNGCYVLTQVLDGKFKRVEPAEKATIACGSDNLVELTQ